MQEVDKEFQKPLILVTNDDGILSPGLCAAVEAVQGLGDLLVVAPRYQQTSMGRSFPRNQDVGIIENFTLTANGCKIDAFGVHGSPAHAVSHGILELAKRLPDLCISGINYGENLGLSISCSGTLGAAFEANSHGVPSIAASRAVDLCMQHESDYLVMDWEVSKVALRELAIEVLNNGMPKNVCILNINVPESADSNTEIRITEQGNGNYSSFIKPETRDLGKSFTLKSRLDVDVDSISRNSDIYALYIDQVISITPLTWNLTAKTEWNYKRLCSDTD